MLALLLALSPSGVTAGDRHTQNDGGFLDDAVSDAQGKPCCLVALHVCPCHNIIH